VVVETVARYRLAPSNRGTLNVWQVPIPGRDVIIGSDTAGGGASGDYSVACVIDAETCALLALWRDHLSPMPWGRAVARLGWYYNEGFLAFETGVSSHGLAACHAAIAAGYRRIFKTQNVRRADMPQSEQLGWPTNSTTKPLMIARVQEALEQNLDIPSEDLLRELSEQRYADTGTVRKVVPEKHDDMMMAYAVALCVRDRAWTAGLVHAAKANVVMDESARYWAAAEEKWKRRQRHVPRRLVS
jgi:hypothetical protein